VLSAFSPAVFSKPVTNNCSVDGSIFGQTNTGGAGSLFGSTPLKNDKPAFSFGAATTGAAAPSFGAPAGNKEQAKPLFGGAPAAGSSSFSFGAKPDENKPSLFGASANNPSAGSSLFGGAQPAAPSATAPSSGFSLSLGSTQNNSSAKPATTPGFNFGSSSKPEEKKETPGFSFGAASKPAESAAAPSFSFGAASKPAEQKNAPATAPSFSFGATADKKEEPKPAFSFGGASTTEKKEEPKPAFSFGGASTTEKKEEPKPSFSFGSAPAPAPEKKAESKPAFSFGGASTTEKKEEPKPAFSFGGASAPEKKEEPKPAFSFGGASATEKKDDKAPATGGFSFGAKPEEKKAESKPATGGFSFGAKVDEKKDTTDEHKEKKTVSFSTSVTEKKDEQKTVEVQPVSLNNKTLEDIITKWTNQLTNTSKSFEEYSARINEWDTVLVEGGDKISQLYSDVVAAEQTQGKVDQSLLYIERQQNELETFLDNYEVKAQNLLTDVLSSSSQQRDSSVLTNDQKREQAYRTAELLDENLNSLGTNLSSLISEINDVSESFNKVNGLGTSKDTSKEEEDSSLGQIVKLLSSHLDSLRFIESSSDDLKAKLDRFKGVEL
jgi:nuclear pore complex protein Nup62